MVDSGTPARAEERDIVGLEVDSCELVVEAGKIREFVRASGVQAPEHTDWAVARDRGFRAVPATLTHSVVLAHQRDQRGFVAKLGLDMRRVVVGSVEWVFERPLVAGDELSATRVVVGDARKTGGSGPLRLITLETRVTEASGDLVATVVEVLIERACAS